MPIMTRNNCPSVSKSRGDPYTSTRQSVRNSSRNNKIDITSFHPITMKGAGKTMEVNTAHLIR